MVVGELAEPVDLLIVGGGPGGYTAALRAAALGRSVVLVERQGPQHLGGACLHVGCIPSKALIELAEAVHRSAELEHIGVVGGPAGVDLDRFQAWRSELTSGLAAGVAGLLRRAGVEVLTGTARFTAMQRVAVTLPDGNARFLEFEHAILATGSRPAPLAGLPFDGQRVVDSTGVLALRAVPESVAVVGAGYIGMELGMALARLGARVTLVEALDRVLPSVDPTLARPVLRRLDELGVEVLLEARAAGLDENALLVETADGPHAVPGALVVVAVGRRPNTDELRLDAAGVELTSSGLVVVGPDRRATARIAAIGDIVEGPALAHKAMAEALIAADALCGRPAAFEPAAIPQVIFTDPEIASVGLTEAEARAEGLDAVTAMYPMSANGRARTLGREAGHVQIVADRATDRVIGVHVVGPHASELISEGTLAIEMQASPLDVASTIHPHPTLGEALHDAVSRVASSLEAAPAAVAR